MAIAIYVSTYRLKSSLKLEPGTTLLATPFFKRTSTDPAMNLEVTSVPISSPIARTMVDELERELRTEYPPHYIHDLDIHAFEESRGIFLVCTDAQETIGCLGLRPLSQNTGELKRMYVRPQFRGRGAARLMLTEMEHLAASIGLKRIVLETGNQQNAAIDLYKANGYQKIPPYNQASDGPASMCFGKPLSG